MPTEKDYEEMFANDNFSWDDEEVKGEDDEIVEEDEVVEDDHIEDEPESEIDDSDEPTENEEDEETLDEGDTTDFVELKHLGETKRVSRGEAKKLAQKGLDYDRIRTKYDELKQFEGKADQLKFLEELATAYGQSIEDVIEDWRIRKLAEDEKVSEEKAQALYYKRLAKNGTPKAEEVDLVKAKQKRDFDEMRLEFPDLDPKTLPKEVWDAYLKADNKRSLFAIYTSHLKNNPPKAQKNKERSMGSVKSKGGSRKGGWGIGFNDDLD